MEGSSNSAATATAAPTWAEPAMERVLWSPEELEKRVEEIANAISEDFSGKPLAVVGVRKLCFQFSFTTLNWLILCICMYAVDG